MFWTATDPVTFAAAIATIAPLALWMRERARLTELRRVHSALAASVGLLEQATGLAVVTIDAGGSIRGYNSAAESLFGYDTEQVRGRSILQLLLLNEAAREQTSGPAGGCCEIRCEARHRDGTFFPVLLRAIPLSLEPPLRVRLFIEDLSPQQLQTELEAENQLLWPTFDEAGLVIAVTDPSGGIIRLSGAGLNLLGLYDAELQGRPYWEVFQKRDDWAASRTAFEQAKTKLGPTRLAADWVAREQPVPLDWLMLSPSWDRDGELRYMVVTAALSSQASALSQQRLQRAAERVAGRIAANFENLLSTINGYSELVLHELNSSSPLRKDVEQILSASERASAITRQLLDFSGRRLLVPERVDLRFLLRKTPRDVEVEAGDEPAAVLGNRKSLEEMLTALAEYAEAQDVRPVFTTLHVRLPKPHATIADDLAPGRYVKLSLGLGGISVQEVLQHAREPFGSPLLGTQQPALGLAVVSGIARSCGGGVSLSRAVNETILEVWLLAAATPETPARRPAWEIAATPAILPD